MPEVRCGIISNPGDAVVVHILNPTIFDLVLVSCSTADHVRVNSMSVLCHAALCPLHAQPMKLHPDWRGHVNCGPIGAVADDPDVVRDRADLKHVRRRRKGSASRTIQSDPLMPSDLNSFQNRFAVMRCVFPQSERYRSAGCAGLFYCKEFTVRLVRCSTRDEDCVPGLNLGPTNLSQAGPSVGPAFSRGICDREWVNEPGRGRSCQSALCHQK
jgi:hypothetical protein